MTTKKGKLAQFSAMVGAANMTMTIAKDLRTRYDEKRNYIITVDEDSYIFDDLMLWLHDHTSTRRFKIYSTYAGPARMYDASGESKVKVNGHTLRVTLAKPDTAGNPGIMALGELGMTGSMKEALTFTATTMAGVKALEDKMMDLTMRKRDKKREVQIFNFTSGNYWNPKALPFRDINYVYLPEGVKEDLIENLNNFRNSESKFNALGFPWHMGMMFYGPPGNGKSSIASALAHRLKMDIYNLPLSGLTSDRHLSDAVSTVGANSLLLIEDIDIFSNVMNRKQEKEGPTLAGLLNALDGVATPHGLITIITTNHVETLDDALIRAGRIDYRLELKPPVQYQIDAAFRAVYDADLGVEAREFDSMASVAEIMKRNINDEEAARLEIKTN